MTFWGPTIGGIDDVAARNLCSGCGVCAYLQPDSIRMVDAVDEGRRPVVAKGAQTAESLGGCPGIALGHPNEPNPDVVPELLVGWGPVLEVWEGYAADPEIRFKGSSGGAATALSLHAITEGGMFGVLHTAARKDAPLLNETVMSRSRADLVAATGSRYAPASPGDGLQRIEDAPAPCVFVGKPCDVAGVDKARQLRPELDAKLGLTIAIFCAGTPSTRGTLELVKQLGLEDPAAVTSLRYRGNGWPGEAVAEAIVDGEVVERTMSYDESWGRVLERHVEWRCRVCVDHTGEFADISVGDPWYRDIQPDEAGRSLVVVRTDRGRRFLEAAVRAGTMVAERVDADRLPASQPNLYRTRGSVWARVMVSRMAAVAAPRYSNMPAAEIWRRHLTLGEKGRSIAGTARRIMTRRLHRRRPAPQGEERA